MSIPSIFSNVIVQGNVVDAGGSVGTPFGYNACMATNADCKILENNFSGINTNGILLSLTNCSCIIQNNFFVRGTTAISQYIYDTGIALTTVAPQYEQVLTGTFSLVASSTIGFPSSGRLYIQSSSAGFQTIAYTSISGLVFNGCTVVFGSGTTSGGDIISGNIPTFLTGGTYPFTLPQATINVASTANFPPYGGTIVITHGSTSDVVTYTGTTPTSFTGCSGGTGTHDAIDAVYWQPSKFDHTITDNVFDQITVDGIDTNLANNITQRSIYNSNTNQMGFITIPLYNLFNEASPYSGDTKAGGNPDNPPIYNFTAYTYASNAISLSGVAQNNFGLNTGAPANIPFESMYVGMHGHTIGTSAGFVGFNFNGQITQFLPPNVKVLNATVGFVNAGATFNGTENTLIGTSTTNIIDATTFQLELLATNPTNITTYSRGGSLMDVYNSVVSYISGQNPGPSTTSFNGALQLLDIFAVNTTSIAGYVTYTDSQLASGTRYLSISNSNDAFSNSLNQDIYVNIQVNFNIPASSGADVVASPLLIQYIW
jgi:hypothetical protein